MNDKAIFDPLPPEPLFADFDKEDGVAEYMLRGANTLYEAWDDDMGDAYFIVDGEGWKLTLITGGWSDNEELLQRLPRIWKMTCWDRSERGGLHVFSYGEAAHIFAESDARRVCEIRSALEAADLGEHECNRVIDWLADRLAHPGTSRWPSPQSIQRSAENVLKPVVNHGTCDDGPDGFSRMLMLACGHVRYQRRITDASAAPDMAVCDRCPDPDHRVVIPSDDGPIDNAPALEIMGGEDWYVGVVRPGERRALEAVRFCTSGARSYAMTSTIALLDAVARDDDAAIHRRLRWLQAQIGPVHGYEDELTAARRGWALAHDDGTAEACRPEGARRFAAQQWGASEARRLFPLTDEETAELLHELRDGGEDLNGHGLEEG